MSSARLRNRRRQSHPLSVYQTAEMTALPRCDRALQMDPSRIQRMVESGEEMTVADALMDHLKGMEDPPLQELLDIVTYCTFGVDQEAADAADTLPSGDGTPEASTESRITDPPIPPVVRGASLYDCLAGEPTSEALSRSSSPYSTIPRG
jgi:hypothetical protein